MREPQSQPWPKRFTVYKLDILTEINMDASGTAKKIQGLATPTVGEDATNKDYVDTSIATAIGDLIDKGEVDAATVAALPANTRTANVLKADAVGAFPTIDGVAAALNNTYLVKDEGGVAAHINNGIYVLTVVGDGVTEWELTRQSNLTNGDHAAGAFLHVQQGTVNSESTFRCINNTSSDVVNTDALEFLYWGQTTDHKYLKNLAWSVAAHTIDTNIDMNSNSLTEVTSIEATGAADITVKLGDNAGAKKFILADSDGTEIFSVNSDGVVSIFDSTGAESGTITRSLTDFLIDSGTGSDTLTINLAGATKLSMDISHNYSHQNFIPDTDSSKECGLTSRWWSKIWGDELNVETINIWDSTHAESASITRDLDSLIIDAGTGSINLKMYLAGVQYLQFSGNTVSIWKTCYPVTDSLFDIGRTDRYWDDGFIDDLYTEGLHIQDGTHAKTHDITATLTSLDIAAEEVAGTAMAINFNIPVGAGGAAAAALDHQLRIDGVMEAGLLAETDGAGTYREPVFKIPAYSADYGVAWASPPNPTPASLVDGGMFTAHNTNDDTYRLYAYLNAGWRSVEAASHTLLHGANHKDGGSDEIDLSELAGALGGAGEIPETDGAAVTWVDPDGRYDPKAHKDSHDPEDGSDPLDAATPGSIDENANAEGSAHEFARADHNHQHLASLHENGGGAEIDVTDLSGLLADDQHIIDAEAVSAMGAKADSNPLNHDKGIEAGTSFPGTPSDGDIFNRTDLGMVFRYDATRVKWLSEHSEMFTCGRGTVAEGSDTYCFVGGATMSSTNGIRMPRNGTIIAVTVQNLNTVTRTIDYRVNNSAVNRVQLALTAAVGGKDIAANQDFSADDLIQVLALLAAGNAMAEIIATIEVKWRA